ncbi:MAG: acetyltransferase [Marinilabiliaceae bacterium]|nr:acetyltransferase [Marinilabiliaceae bacterium]
MSKKPIILVGGGGHCISCIEVINSIQEYEIIGVLDLKEKVGKLINGVEIIGTDDDIPELVKSCSNFLITVGQIKSSALRHKIFELIESVGGNLPTIVSPYAYVSSTSLIGKGTIVMHKAMVNVNAKVGINCILNTGCLIEHETEVDDFCHVSTHSVLNGQVNIGSNCFIGSSAVIANNISIPAESIIAAGAVVLKNPTMKGTFIGNPAKRI